MLVSSAYVSLFIQAITGFVNVWGLGIQIPADKNIFRDLLQTELIVQTIEFFFYLWMVSNLTKIKNITPYRYIDWMITTPVMLTTLMAFLEKDPRQSSLRQFIENNKNFLGTVIVLNFFMLFFGLMGELQIIGYDIAITLGFIPFVYYFKMMYDRYITVPDLSKDRRNLFWFFAIIWSLYGFVAFLPYKSKNVSYNALDVISKNLFGVFLVYILWSNRE